MTPAGLLRTATLAFVTLLPAIVAYRMLTGRIRLAGLLADKRTGRFSLERGQLLLLTLAGGIAYWSSALAQAAAAPAGTPPAFPPLDDSLVYALGGSNLFYLAGKFARTFLRTRDR